MTALLLPAALLCAVALAAPPAALRQQGPLSPRNATYTLKARLDEKLHVVHGQGTLLWRNVERQPVDHLVFHLYLNAFKNYASTFIQDAGPQLRGAQMEAHGFGAIDVKSMQAGGQDLLQGATLDDTLLSVPLRQQVGPGSAVQVDFTFEAQLPKVFARSGYAGDFHAVGQWFPKIGVWDCDDSAAAHLGQDPAEGPGPPGPCHWRAHQYHGQTEFFADYGNYDVELDVPAQAVVGATGVLVEEHLSQGRKLLRYHAEDVHDFMWVSDPRFVEVTDTLQDQWGAVSIRLLTRAPYLEMNARHLRAAREGLLELERRLGPYPYGNVTVVVPPSDALGASGMEYPTLFVTAPGDTGAGVHIAEETTIHELGHQFFYGILGTDEVEEPWLDEGLNETFTTWGMERLFGPRCNLFDDVLWVCLADLDSNWLSYRRTAGLAAVDTRGQAFPPDSYAEVVYAQTTIAMRTLERYLGPARLEAGMRRYADRQRFHHPRRADFVAAFDQGAGEDLRWFWDQALSSTKVADYEVLEARTEPHRPAAGLWDCPPGPPGMTSRADPVAQELVTESLKAACAAGQTGRRELDPDQGQRGKDAALHDSEVWVRRRGDFIFPVTIQMTFRDGTTQREQWGLAEQQAQPEVRTRRFRYLRRKSPLARVDVDPDRALVLDTRRLNNGLLLERDRVPARRLAGTWLGLLQTLLDVLGT